MASFYPLVGTWFLELETNQRFEIVAIDDKQRTIEVQYYDGDVGEFDIESWGALNIIETETPDAAYSSADSNSPFADDVLHMDSYTNPLESIEPDTFHGFDDLY